CQDGYTYQTSRHSDKRQQRHVLSSADSAISCKSNNAGKERRHNGKGDTNQTKSIACVLFSGRYSQCVLFVAVRFSHLATTPSFSSSPHNSFFPFSVMVEALSDKNILAQTVGFCCSLDDQSAPVHSRATHG